MAIKLNLKKILTDSCDVLANTPGSDDYGQTPGVAGDTILQGQACRVLPIKRPFHESKTGQRDAINQFTVFILPPSDGTVLSEKLWIKIDTGINTGLYNITHVEPPVIDGAPYELTTERIKV